MEYPTQDYWFARRILHGDAQAWAQFYLNVYDKLYKYAYGLARKYNTYYLDYEDVVAIALSRCHNKIYTFKPEGVLYNWVCGYIKNIFLSEHKKHYTHNAIVNKYNKELYEQSYSYYSKDPCDLLLIQEVDATVRIVLFTLCKRHQILLIQKHLHNKPLTKIAAQLGDDYSHVRKEYHTARSLFAMRFHILYHRGDWATNR